GGLAKVIGGREFSPLQVPPLLRHLPPFLLRPSNRHRRNARMKWVTRHRVKVDRVACPWLIRKFVDPQAQFLFVPPEQVMDVVRRENAIPYDVPEVEFGHHGKECSFEAIVKK